MPLGLPQRPSYQGRPTDAPAPVTPAAAPVAEATGAAEGRAAGAAVAAPVAHRACVQGDANATGAKARKGFRCLGTGPSGRLPADDAAAHLCLAGKYLLFQAQ